MQATEPSLERQIHLALTGSPYLSSRRHLRFETHSDRVVLRGNVPSYFHKQMAQEAVRRVQGVTHIENHLEVIWA